MARPQNILAPDRISVSSSEGAPKVSAKEVWKKFIHYYQPYTLLFFADLVCATVLACIDLAFPQILNFFVRDFFVNSRQAIIDVLPWVAAGLIVTYLIRSACQYFIGCWGHIMGARMEANMRMDLFSQYQRLSFSYYDRNNTGEMMSKLVTDLFDISEVAHHGPENIFIATFKIVGSFVLLMLISVPLTLVMLAVTVIMVVYAAVLNYRRRIVFRQNRVTMASLNARIQDSLGGIRVVKSFGNEAIEMEHFGTSNEEFIHTKELSYRFMGQFQMATSLFQGALYITTIVAGGWFVYQGVLDAPALIMYALYIGIFIAPIELLINFTEQFQKGYAGFRRFVETLAEVPDVQEHPQARDLQKVIDSFSAAGKSRQRTDESQGSAEAARSDTESAAGDDVRSNARGSKDGTEGATRGEGAPKAREKYAKDTAKGDVKDDARHDADDVKSADENGTQHSAEDVSKDRTKGGMNAVNNGANNSSDDTAKGTATDTARQVACAPSVRYDHVMFSYDGVHDVLNDFCLTIPAGKTVALVGPSGGGKTTACSLLPRFYDVRSGSVSIDGIDVREVTLDSLRNVVGLVQQDVYLFEGTLRDNILYGNPYATQREVESAAKQADIHNFIMSLPQGYDTYVGERGARLSGGQKQRVSIARVFLRDPRILVLDEATSALDNESERIVQASLELLSKNRTTLVIAHRLSTIRNADVIAAVENGHVAELGTHDELMAQNGLYAKYYRLQFAVQESDEMTPIMR